MILKDFLKVISRCGELIFIGCEKTTREKYFFKEQKVADSLRAERGSCVNVILLSEKQVKNLPRIS